MVDEPKISELLQRCRKLRDNVDDLRFDTTDKECHKALRLAASHLEEARLELNMALSAVKFPEQKG